MSSSAQNIFLNRKTPNMAESPNHRTMQLCGLLRLCGLFLLIPYDSHPLVVVVSIIQPLIGMSLKSGDESDGMYSIQR